MSAETLSVRYVRALLDAVEHRGVSRASYLAAAGWDPAQLDDGDGRIPDREFYRLCELALDLTGEPTLGLIVLKVVRPQSVDLVGQLVAHAPTTRQALDALLRLQKLGGDRGTFSLFESERGVTLRYDCPSGPSARVRRFLAEMHMSGAYRMFRYFARGARPIQVDFEHEAPHYACQYRHIFKGVERFGRPSTEIVFERGFMNVERRYSDKELHRTLRDLAQERISRLERGISCADRVRGVLSGHDTPGKITMATTASQLGISQRSLRRRLAAEGTSFDLVVNEALAERARRMLSVEGRTIQETAFALGYADTTAFHRAFKRWTGTTPKLWRDGMQSDDDEVAVDLIDD